MGLRDPRAPAGVPLLWVKRRVRAVQRVVEGFEYNASGAPVPQCSPLFTLPCPLVRLCPPLPPCPPSPSSMHIAGATYCVAKGRPLAALLQTGRRIAEERRPIQCIEGTLLALFLTHGFAYLQRCPPHCPWLLAVDWGAGWSSAGNSLGRLL